MDQKLLDLKTEALSNIEACDNLARINELRVEYLGKKGFLSGLSSNMGKLQPSERAEFGKKINEVKNAITTSLEEKRIKLEEEALNKRLESESIDISLNGVNSNPGTKHIIQEMIDEGKPIEMHCHFCNTSYQFTVEELKEILKKSR